MITSCHHSGSRYSIFRIDSLIIEDKSRKSGIQFRQSSLSFFSDLEVHSSLRKQRACDPSFIFTGLIGNIFFEELPGVLFIEPRGGSEGMAMSWPPCDVISRKRNERLLREISFSCPFSSLTNFIFSIFTRSENHIR